MESSTVIKDDIVIDALEDGFEMWAEHATFQFPRVKSREKVGAQIEQISVHILWRL